MNSEISKSEVNEVKNPSMENFKKIKPELFRLYLIYVLILLAVALFLYRPWRIFF